MLYSIYDRGLNDALQRRLGIKDDVGVNLMPELAAVLDIDREDEFQYYLGWRTFSVERAQAAVAAQATEVQFQNPPASGMIGQLLQISVFSGAADNFVIGFPGVVNAAALATNVGSAAIMDGRMKAGLGAIPNGQMNISFTTVVPTFTLGGNAFASPVPANTLVNIPLARPFILVPGTTILMGFLTVNIQQGFNFLWRERVLNDQEGSP